ncbi:MAG TPA: ABC transporter substrate-binding protein [Brevefilum sp.]|nr:ABC transporter substrate-binding protein [Brevefilum sp.]HPL69023.1 ABC transporter substrate-binding protein [Brevefilum sp.]
MMNKRVLFFLGVLIIFTMILSACQPAAETPAVEEPAAEVELPPAEPAETVKIDFWHSMGGDLGGVAIPQMADDFNASQSQCFVEPIYQGSYDDALNKLRASLQSQDVPAVMQLYDIGTRLMVDLGMTTPVQEFIDKDNYDVSDLEPNVLAYYTVDGIQASMPFNTSTPMLYYNKDMFRAAGLDPEQPPRTFEEIWEAARVLNQVDASGNVVVSGISMSIYGWFFEQYLAVSGGYYANNANGRDALATEATFNSPEGVAILEWWKGMWDEGLMGNYGRVNADVRTAFYAEQTAMFVDSTAVLRGAMDTVDGKFEIGTAYLPRPNEAAFDTSGTIIGGGSLWIINASLPEEQACAWEFIKYQASPEQQAYWHTMSGYFPIRDTAYEVPLAIEWRDQYPQFKTAVDQLHLAPNNRVTQGGLIGVFPTARQTIEGAIEEVLAGVATPQEALDKAAQIVTDAIEEYNISMGLVD